MSGVQIYPSFRSSTAAELTSGQWGYCINDSNGEFTLFLSTDDAGEQVAKVVLFSSEGAYVRHIRNGDNVLFLEGEIEIDLTGDSNFPMSHLEGDIGDALFGIYRNDLVLAVAKMTANVIDKYLFFNLANNQVVDGGLDYPAFWWKAASIRYRKDQSREWITLHSL